MSYADEHPGYALGSSDEIRRYLIAEVDKCIDSRYICDVQVPGDDVTKVEQQKKNERKYMVRFGHALGAIVLAHKLRHIEDVTYNELTQKVNQTLVPTVIHSRI